ncbi:hypothetical protein NUACC26_056590 [Scytonema sp. NUACC26]
MSIPKSLKKNQQIGYLIQQAKFVLAAIGERGVMKVKILSLTLMLSLAAVLGACEGGGGGGGTTGGDTSSPAATSTSAPEPTDTGAASPAPTATTTDSPTASPSP